MKCDLEKNKLEVWLQGQIKCDCDQHSYLKVLYE